MKKVIVPISLFVLSAMLFLTAEIYTWKGAGAIVDVTDTAQVVIVPGSNYCYSVSVYNTGSTTLFFSIGTTTNGFVATNAVPVPAGIAYSTPGGSEANEDKSRSIRGIIISTTNGTGKAAIAFN
jgi:hypothetical protein